MKCKTDEKNTKIEKNKKEINYDDLSDNFYTFAHNPITKKINFNEETDLEEKFGESKSFFINGESWPMDSDDISMKFFCQLKDPRKSDNFLYRVFLPIDNENNDLLQETFIDKFELNEENLKNQIIIDKPKSLDDENKDDNFKPFKIIDWRITKELKSFYYIISELNIDEYSEDDWDKYHNSIYLPSSNIKVGGTPVYT